MPVYGISYATEGVYNPSSGGGGADNPVIGLLVPNFGSVLGGDTITIYGGNFGAAGGSVTVGGVAVTVSYWSDTQIIGTTGVHAQGAVSAVVTTADSAIATRTNAYTYYPASSDTPILTRIESAIEDIITAMDTASGFAIDHGLVNTEDRAQWDTTLCNHMVEIEPEIANDEDPNAAFQWAYHQRARFKITSWPVIAQSTNPHKSANAALTLALDDLLRAFGRNPSVNGTCGTIRFLNAERETQPSGDRIIPKKIASYWEVEYTQNRYNPEIYAN